MAEALFILIVLLAGVVVAGLFVFTKFIAPSLEAKGLQQMRQDEYIDYSSFLIEEHMFLRTMCGFKTPYKVRLNARCINEEEYRQNRMHKQYERQLLGVEFCAHLRRFLADGSFVFSMNSELMACGDFVFLHSPCVYERIAGEGEARYRTITTHEVANRIQLAVAFQNHGCHVDLLPFYSEALSPLLIEENHNLLSQPTRDAMELNDEVIREKEVIAVTVLQRQLAFLRSADHQTHQAKEFYIETSIAGKCLNLRWKFKQSSHSFELLGFRRSGGFALNQWDENENGTLVVHSYDSGETTEALSQGEAHFYTFFVRQRGEGGRTEKWSPLRFQVRLPADEEEAEIKRLLESIKKKTGPPSVIDTLRMDLESLLSANEALDALQVAAVNRIKERRLSAEQELEQIERLSDLIRQKREQYDLL